MRAPSFADESAQTILDEAITRGTAAWDALRGERAGPPVAKARWPWALAAAAAGAALAVAVVIATRGLGGPEAPNAQEPEDLEAVIDRPATGS